MQMKTAPYFGYALYDSLKLTMTLFPEIMKLTASEALWEQITATSSYLLDSGYLSKNLIKEYGKYMIESGRRELKKDKQEIEEASYMYSDLVKLLGVVGTPEAVALLKQFTKFDAREIKFRTYIALLEANQAAESRTAYTLAINDEYRHHLYDQLKTINRLKLFPVTYLSQKELGRSKVYEAAVEDEDDPGVISDEGDKVILYKGKQQRFYLYKVYDYLAVAGPYPMNAKDMSSNHEATGIYWSEEFDEKNIEKLFNDYIKQLAEPDTEEKEGQKPPPPPKDLPPGIEIKKN